MKQVDAEEIYLILRNYFSSVIAEKILYWKILKMIFRSNARSWGKGHLKRSNAFGFVEWIGLATQLQDSYLIYRLFVNMF